MFTIKSLDHIALVVKDVDASAKWYAETLGLKQMDYEGAWGKVPLMLFSEANNGIALFPGEPKPRGGMMHFAFLLDYADFKKAQDELREKGIEFMFEDHIATHSIYMRDPDGYNVELTAYNPDYKRQ
jgi:catechol 2,3-dioxygenase